VLDEKKDERQKSFVMLWALEKASVGEKKGREEQENRRE
jgi:hypothetical protein